MSIVEEHLPIVEVVDQNIQDVWPQLQKTVMDSSFIAIDTEMSGLGDKKKLFYPEVDMRYKYMAELAHSHGTLSMGFSCYKCTRSDNTGQHYTVRTFDVLVLPETGFTVQADSLKFLQSHGFNFNKLVQHGLPYTPGNDPLDAKAPTEESSDSSTSSDAPSSTDGCPAECTARGIFRCLVAARKPVVLHNGFVDLVFLYQHFYAELPKKLETFASNINEMFPLGIYDTKYFSEFVNRTPATYLQFVYVKELLYNERCRQEQQQQTGVAPHVRVAFPSQFTLLSGLMYFRHLRGLHQDSLPDDSRRTCSSFSYHGWCKVGDSCLDSHNVRRIVKELCNTGKKAKVGGSPPSKGSSGSRAHFRSGPRSTGTSAMLQSALRHNALYTNAEKQASKRAKVESEKVEDIRSEKQCRLGNGLKVEAIDDGLPAIPCEQPLDAERGGDLADDAGALNGGVAKKYLKQRTIESSNCRAKSEQNGNGAHTEFNLFRERSVINGPVSANKDIDVFSSTNCNESRNSNRKMSETKPRFNDLLTNGTNCASKRDESLTNHKEDFYNSSTIDTSSTVHDSKPLHNLGDATNGSDSPPEDGSVKGVKRGLALNNADGRRTISNTSTSEGHSSGFDAFMTGFIFASYICQNALAELSLESEDFLPSALGLKDHVNKVYLMGKNFPFLVKSTPFAKPSNNHTKKINNIRKLYSARPLRESHSLNGALPHGAAPVASKQC